MSDDEKQAASVYRDCARQFRKSAELVSEPAAVKIFWRLAKVFDDDADRLDPCDDKKPAIFS